MEKLKTRVSAVFVMMFLVCAMAFGVGCGQAEGTNQTKETNQADTEDTAQNENEIEDSADAGVSAFSMEKNVKSGKPEELTVQFLDVGQGSAALISQNGEYMLVDGGDRDYSSFVVSYLKQQGVTRLSCVVVSHYDADHLNGVVGVLNALECDKVLAPDYEGDTKVYQSFLDVVKEKAIPLEHPKLNDSYAFSYSNFEVVSPAAYQYDDANANSLGIRLIYGENSFLICGDCTQESEEDLLYTGVDVKSDVYAANHHGSKYSNSGDFLKAVSPEAVVISCGMGNSYGHPDASVLLAIQELGADLYRTDLQGTVTVVSDGTDIKFDTEPSMDYRSGPELAGESKTLPKTENESKEVPEPGEEPKEVPEPPEISESEKARDYVLNTNTMKFHLPSCSSAETIKDENKAAVYETRESVLAGGYSPCKRCSP